MQRGTRERGGWLLPIVLTLGLLLPPLYVLSIGPAAYLYYAGLVSRYAIDAYAYPADSLGRRCLPIRHALDTYEHVFYELGQKKHPPTLRLPRHFFSLTT